MLRYRYKTVNGVRKQVFLDKLKLGCKRTLEGNMFGYFAFSFQYFRDGNNSFLS